MFHRPHIARVAGEAIDADQVFAPCDCGCDYHGHECVYQIDYSAEYLAMTPDEREAALKAVHDKIAAAFAPKILDLTVTKRADGSAQVAA